MWPVSGHSFHILYQYKTIFLLHSLSLPAAFLFFKMVLGIPGLLYFLSILELACQFHPLSLKNKTKKQTQKQKLLGFLIVIALNLKIKLGRTALLKIMSISIHEPKISFHFSKSSLIFLNKVL